MPRYRIKAYFIHEAEEKAAHKAAADGIIASPEWTAGYVLGIVDPSAIPKLEKQGLVIAPIEPLPETTAAPPENQVRDHSDAHLLNRFSERLVVLGMGAELPGDPTSAAPARRPRQPRKIQSRDRRRTQYYIVHLSGPLTRKRRAELKRHGLSPLESVARDHYTMRLTPKQVTQLASLDFVSQVRLYNSADTLRKPTLTSAQLSLTNASSALAKASKTPKERRPKQRAATKNARMTVLTVRAHRAKDLRTVIKWLTTRKRKPLWTGKDTLRVALRVPGRDVDGLARLPEVASVEEQPTPRVFDEFACRILGLEPLHTARSPLQLRGKGELIGIADTGLDISHPDFKGRIAKVVALGRRRDASDPEGHGTHVTGCAAGDGRASGGKVIGAAPEARIYFQSILDRLGGLGGLPKNLARLFKQAYAKGVRIHNNSWGAFAFARYSNNSMDVDRFVQQHPDMLIVFAAGNDGIAVPRVPGASMQSLAGFVDWPSVAEPAAAKNALTVGASRNSRTSGGYSTLQWRTAWADRYPQDPIGKELISGDPQSLAAFSSRGPCTDQRIKPDVVAPGTDIAAARSKDAPLRKFWGAYPKNDYYGFMGGTSMAAPYVAGCAALVREWYRKRHRHTRPSAALIKATLINGTTDLRGKDARAAPKGYPNYHQGFGCINMANTLPDAAAPRMELAWFDSWRKKKDALPESGDRMRFSVRVGAGVPLRICMCWTDPPGNALQNRLVLLVDDGAGHKWWSNERAVAPLKVSGMLEDSYNNVHVVRLETPAAGLYTLAVTAETLLFLQQHFALVVTGNLLSPLVRT